MAGHMAKNYVNKKKKPTFAKFLFPGYSTQHLAIPQGFLKHIRHDQCRSAILQLKVSSGHSWVVRVRKTTDGVHFEDGWEQFLRGNSLDDNEFLVFTYEGRMHFTVDVFHKSGCDFGSIRKHQAFANTSKRPRGRPSKFSESTSNHPGPSNPCKEEEQEYDVHLDGAEREPFKTNLPHFTTTIRLSHNVPVPTAFSNDHFPTYQRHEVTLKNAKGEEWVVRAAPSHRSHMLTAGWSKFAVDNHITINDVCLFELVKGNMMIVRNLGKRSV